MPPRRNTVLSINKTQSPTSTRQQSSPSLLHQYNNYNNNFNFNNNNNNNTPPPPVGGILYISPYAIQQQQQQPQDNINNSNNTIESRFFRCVSTVDEFIQSFILRHDPPYARTPKNTTISSESDSAFLTTPVVELMTFIPESCTFQFAFQSPTMLMAFLCEFRSWIEASQCGFMFGAGAAFVEQTTDAYRVENIFHSPTGSILTTPRSVVVGSAPVDAAKLMHLSLRLHDRLVKTAAAAIAKGNDASSGCVPPPAVGLRASIRRPVSSASVSGRLVGPSWRPLEEDPHTLTCIDWPAHDTFHSYVSVQATQTMSSDGDEGNNNNNYNNNTNNSANGGTPLVISETERRAMLKNNDVPIIDTITSTTAFNAFDVYETYTEGALQNVVLNVFLSYRPFADPTTIATERRGGGGGVVPYVSNDIFRVIELMDLTRVVRSLHREDNPYHNEILCIDVVQTLHCLLVEQNTTTSPTAFPFDFYTLAQVLVSALLLVVGHQGVSERFLQQIGHDVSSVFPLAACPGTATTVGLAATLLLNTPRTNMFPPSWLSGYCAAFCRGVVENITAARNGTPKTLAQHLLFLALHQAILKPTPYYRHWTACKAVELSRQSLASRDHGLEDPLDVWCVKLTTSNETDRRREMALIELDLVRALKRTLRLLPSNVVVVPQNYVNAMREHKLLWIKVLQQSPSPPSPHPLYNDTDLFAQESHKTAWTLLPTVYTKPIARLLSNPWKAVSGAGGRGNLLSAFDGTQVDELKIYRLGCHLRGVLEHASHLCEFVYSEVEDLLHLSLACRGASDFDRQKRFRQRFFHLTQRWLELIGARSSTGFGVPCVGLLPVGITMSPQQSVEQLLTFLESTPIVPARDVASADTTLDMLGTSIIAMMSKSWISVLMFFQGTDLAANIKHPVGNTRGIHVPPSDPVQETLQRFVTAHQLLSRSAPARKHWRQMKAGLSTPSQ
eukprot:PhM_4_TR7200/c0_g2_i1/m.51410